MYLVVLGGPLIGLMPTGVYFQLKGWQIYHRIGNYSIAVSTFFWQLEHPGFNFPGPNVLEAVIDRQPSELRAIITEHRRRLHVFRRVFLWYLGLAGMFLVAAAVGRRL
ncbi:MULTISPECIES: hypothetical protein [unclassified Bradyrhizobium]|uniref:hypothetical protein n=1 Tax=unclassified Bradyrhizobium TaxID=2631580 RepID=UPI0024E06167|nr:MULTISPECIES: hypothetical protein [unclassified Bradyrhizobium]